MNLPVVRVTCAVIIRDGKVFAARRGPHSKQPLKWEFPGGKVEPGETDTQCLHRELDEELAIRVRIERPLPVHTHHYPEFTIELVPFLCMFEGPVPAGKQGEDRPDHLETAWLSPDELPGMDWTAADVPVAAYVLKHVL